MISLVKVDSLRLSKLKMTLPHPLKLGASFVYTKRKNKADMDGTKHEHMWIIVLAVFPLAASDVPSSTPRPARNAVPLQNYGNAQRN